MQNNYLNHKKIYKTKKKERVLNLPRAELAVQRWLEMAKEAQDTRRSSDTEQQCNVCRQVVAVRDRGEVGRRRHDRGRDVCAKEGVTRAQQRRHDGGAQEGATEARRWQNLLPFRLLFSGGARPSTLTSWTESQSAMEGNEGRIVWRARWRRGFAREKMMNNDGFARFGNLNKGYGLDFVNTRGIKHYRPRSFATRGQIVCYRPRSFVTRGQIMRC